jgi:hypothetical protein
MEVENVRVVVRLRPLNQEEFERDSANIVEVDGNVLTLLDPTGNRN